MTPISIPIVRRHDSIAAGVAALNIDLSYNERIAKREIAELDEDETISGVFDDGKNLWFISEAHDGLQTLNKFEPFNSCISSAPFRVMVLEGNRYTQVMTAPKTLEVREAIRNLGAFAL